MNWSQQQTVISWKSPFFVQLKTRNLIMAKIRKHLLRKEWKNPVRMICCRCCCFFYFKINSSAKNWDRTRCQFFEVNNFLLPFARLLHVKRFSQRFLFFTKFFSFRLCAPHLFSPRVMLKNSNKRRQKAWCNHTFLDVLN